VRRHSGDGQLTFQRDTDGPARSQASSPRLRDLGANVIRVNCVPGGVRVEYRQTARGSGRLSAQPNAGQPQVRQQAIVYPGTPKSFGEYALRLVEAGASVVGGCCGTTPEHIAAMNQALSGQAATASATISTSRPRPIVLERETPAGAERRRCAKLAAGRFVVTVESTRRGPEREACDRGREAAQGPSVDCLNVGDSDGAHPYERDGHGLMQQNVGIETIVHFVTRDRNLLALEGDLLAARPRPATVFASAATHRRAGYQRPSAYGTSVRA
jgi:homocysteine S-methyltransferase